MNLSRTRFEILDVERNYKKGLISEMVTIKKKTASI